MNSPLDILISKDDLLLIGQQFSAQASPISPFFNLQTASQAQRMPSAALVNPDGTIREEIAPAFQTLARVKSLGFAVYSGEAVAFEASVYYPDGNNIPPVSLFVSEDGLKLQFPPAIANWVNMLGQFVGESLINPLEVDLEMEPQAARVFFGVVDAARRQIMGAMANGEDFEVLSIPVSKIVQMLAEEKLMWLSAYFSASLDLPALGEADVHVYLQGLAQKGLVSFDGENIKPGILAEQLAGTYLTLDGHLRLQASRLAQNNEVQHTAIFGVQGRSQAVLLWTAGDNSVDIFSASPAQTMLLISSVLEAPAGMFSDSPFPVPGAASFQPQSQPMPNQFVPQSQPPMKQSSYPMRPPKKRSLWKWVLIGVAVLFMLGCLLVVGNFLYWEFFY